MTEAPMIEADGAAAPVAPAEGSTATATVAPAVPAAAPAPAPRTQPGDLKPYVDTLGWPPVHDLSHRGHEIHHTVSLRAAEVHYAQGLGRAGAWAYEGTVPGPTFIVRHDQTVRITWANAIDPAAPGGTLPFRVVKCDDPDPATGLPIPQNSPGPGSGVDQGFGALTASTVVHLHGGHSHADSDGWTENVVQNGHAQPATYGTNPRAALLWYHDHAMGVTRLNVYAGLFGLWVIRDPIEDGLTGDGTLPGGKDELFLVIQDRNFDTDPSDGSLTGALLHKTEASTAELFAPYTLVNGAIWPRTRIGAGRVRLRLLNGSNSRTYCLRLVEAELDASGTFTGYGRDLTDSLPWWQVGTDGGLLGTPAPPASSDQSPDSPGPPVNRGLVLSPAERADLVVDFTGLENTAVAFVNTAFAPYHGSTVTFPYKFDPSGVLLHEQDPSGANISPDAAGKPSELFRLPFPDVLLFEVKPLDPKLPGCGASKVLSEATPLASDFVRYVHKSGPSAPGELNIPEHRHRWIALTEFPTGSLFFRELVEVTSDPTTAAATGLPLIAVEVPIPADQQTPGGPTTRVTWFRTAAMTFHDAVTIVIRSGGWEVWNLLNLTVDSHPVHVHLVEFQVLSRQKYNKGGYQDAGGYTLRDQPISLVGEPVAPDPNERGFKDTVRVNPGEAVAIAARFDEHRGRYMYHCHILEHEDHDMMRPIVILPGDILDKMDQGMGGMTM